MYKAFVILLVLSVILTGCSSLSEEEKLSQNKELQRFIRDFEDGKESSVEIAVEVADTPENPNAFESGPKRSAKGVVIYDLVASYDKNTDQKWIHVTPNLSGFKQSEENPVTVMESPEQCGSIMFDDETGYYLLIECFHRWEYRLIR